MSLQAVDKRGPASKGGSHVNRFRHLVHIRSCFETRLREGVDAVGTLQRMRDSQPYQGLFAPRQRALVLTGLVPCHEFLKQIGTML